MTKKATRAAALRTANRFATGVRIIVLSDSGHSGSMTRDRRHAGAAS